MKHQLPSKFVDDEISVVVAGAGGNGSQFISGLARLHISLQAMGHPGLEVTVYDPDIVTEANVGRQLFSPSDIGCYKSEVLVNRINCYYNLQWKAQPVAFSRTAGSTDILVGCVDSIAARRELSKTRFDYWLDLGNSEKKGQVILGNPFEIDYKRVAKETIEVLRDNHPEDKSFDDLKYKDMVDKMVAARLSNVMEVFPELASGKLKEDDAPSCSLAEALGKQDLFINQSVATFALQLLWQFIRQGGLDIHGYFINLESGRVSPLPIDPMRIYHEGSSRKPRKPKRKKKK